MKTLCLSVITIVMFSLAVISLISPNLAFADTWYPGKGLKVGDYFRYNVCSSEWKNCTPIEIDFWVKNETSNGNGWNLEFLAIDGSSVQKGIVTIGTVTPDPTYSDSNILDYSNIYKDTIIWLDSFATADSPKGFDNPNWSTRTGSCCGYNGIRPMGQEQVIIPGGSYNAWAIGGGSSSYANIKFWVVPSMPFPVKGEIKDIPLGTHQLNTYFELLEVGNSQTLPLFESAFALQTYSQSMSSKIPNWVKGVFNYYAQGQISDDNLIKVLQYLIQKEIIKVN